MHPFLRSLLLLSCLGGMALCFHLATLPGPLRAPLLLVLMDVLCIGGLLLAIAAPGYYEVR